MKNLPIQIKILIGIIAVMVVYSTASSVFNTTTAFYNTAKINVLEYKQLEQEQVTTFDNNWMAWDENFNTTGLVKSDFIEVTKIIMENRRDGQNLAWKWLQENQQIPYSEFIKFYSELTKFTRERFAENSNIEKRKQSIAKKHNATISTWPGVFYNAFFHFEPIMYNEGFISNKTSELFQK